MELPELKSLKSLEEENTHLKRLLAESMLEKETLQAMLCRAESTDNRPQAGSCCSDV